MELQISLEATRSRHIKTTVNDMHANLQEELDSLSTKNASMKAQLEDLSKETRSMRSENARLVEENKGWEFLLRERTMSGKILDEGILSRRGDDSDGEQELDDAPVSTKGHAVRRELDTGNLDFDIDTSSTLTDQGANEDERDSHAPSVIRRDSDYGSQGIAPTMYGGSDLATELGRAELDPSEGESHPFQSGRPQATTFRR